MIDVLVERLVQLKGRSYPLEAGQGETDTDALIQKFSTDLAQSLRKAESVSRSMTAGLAHAGMLFDLVA
jgi:hypothetical protein